MPPCLPGLAPSRSGPDDGGSVGPQHFSNHYGGGLLPSGQSRSENIGETAAVKPRVGRSFRRSGEFAGRNRDEARELQVRPCIREEAKKLARESEPCCLAGARGVIDALHGAHSVLN